MYTCICVCMWSDRKELATFFLLVGPWDRTHILWLGGKRPCHLIGILESSKRIFFCVRATNRSVLQELGNIFITEIHLWDLSLPPPITKNSPVYEKETTKARIPCVHMAHLCLSRCFLGLVVRALVVHAALGPLFFRSGTRSVTGRSFSRKAKYPWTLLVSERRQLSAAAAKPWMIPVF